MAFVSAKDANGNDANELIGFDSDQFLISFDGSASCSAQDYTFILTYTDVREVESELTYTVTFMEQECT
jgi:hypothetical protein